MWRISAMLISALIAAQPASAQRPAARDGLWFGGGIGSGWSRVSCDICRESRGGAVSGMLQLGGRVRPNVLVGAEVNGWLGGEGAVDESVWGASAIVQWHPGGRRLWWKGGLGLLSYRARDGQDVLGSTAFGVQLGAGYDLPLSERVVLTPFAGLFVASLGGDVTFNGATILGDADLSLVQIGVAVGRR